MAITRTASRLALVGIAAAAILTLSACTPVTNGAITNYPGWPTVSMPGQGGSGTLENGKPHAMWLGEGDKIAVITYGSSTCPVVGTAIDVTAKAGAGNAVKITEKQYEPNQPCTMDLVAHTTEFWTPQAVTTTEPLKVEIQGTTVTIPIKGAAG